MKRGVVNTLVCHFLSCSFVSLQVLYHGVNGFLSHFQLSIHIPTMSEVNVIGSSLKGGIKLILANQTEHTNGSFKTHYAVVSILEYEMGPNVVPQDVHFGELSYDPNRSVPCLTSLDKFHIRIDAVNEVESVPVLNYLVVRTYYTKISTGVYTIGYFLVRNRKLNILATYIGTVGNGSLVYRIIQTTPLEYLFNSPATSYIAAKIVPSRCTCHIFVFLSFFYVNII